MLKQGQSPKSQGRRLAVTGEPGAGKTTLLQKIAQWVATETEQDVAIWVSLADLQGRSVEEYLLQKWLKDALGAVRVTPEMEDALALLFNSGRVWLLLDGVDEMAAGGNPLATVAAQITGWVAQGRAVLTCRQNVWDAGKNTLEGFDVYRNLDFDYPEGVGQFIQRWFARQGELGERLLAELAQAGKERIRDTVRNPLRLALLCRAWQIRQGGLPETKAGLYEQFAEALYVWKQEAFPTKSKQRRELNAGLGRLALRGMEQSESRFRLREGLLTEVLGETDEPLCRLALQLGWLNLVGVAVENPDERVYAFYHPTFQEYFAALAVDDWGYFLHHGPDNPSLGTYRIFEKQWKEVILLWFGRENVQKEKKEAFIEKLINFDDGCGSWNYRKRWGYQKVDRGFYEYRAYFFGGLIIPEFKESRFADLIVSQIVKWSCVPFIAAIRQGAEAVLAETDRERTISRLIPLLDKTYDEYTRRSVANILGEIAVGNEEVINRLILLLDETYDEDTRRKVTESLGNIAVGNEEVINRLILLLDETYDKDTRRKVTESLGNIAVGNEGAINRLILLLDEISDYYTHESVTESLGKIAVGNEGTINRLILLLDETSGFYNRGRVADILGKIAVGNEGAINRLILLLDKTSDEYTRQSVADIFANIAVGNEGAINRLILLLDKYSHYNTHDSVADSLGKIAVANEEAINRLILLLEETSDGYTRRKVADILGNIAVGNEEVINCLILLLNETSDKYIRREVADSLGNIVVGNEEVINRLILLLDKTSDEYIRQSVANIFANIAVGNEEVINRLILMLDETSDEDTRQIIANSLGNIAVGNEGTINRLILLLDETSDGYTRRTVANSLGNIAVGNEGALNRLILLLDEIDKNNRWRVAESLGKIAVGNEGALNRLILLLDKYSDYYIRKIIADSLGNIAVGNEEVINRLILLLNETSDYYIRKIIAESLGNIAVGNEGAINRLIQLLDETSDEDTRQRIANSLGKIIATKQQYNQVVSALKFNLTSRFFYHKEFFYQITWYCSQNLTYPEFYMAWHSEKSNIWKILWKHLNRPIF